jgi:hypothetical protein
MGKNDVTNSQEFATSDSISQELLTSFPPLLKEIPENQQLTPPALQRVDASLGRCAQP